MNNYDTTRKGLQRAKRWYQSAIRALEDKRWDDVIYSYEMAIEQAFKAILILYGIEYPKKHDISSIFIQLKQKDIPDNYLGKIDEYANLLKYLVEKRGPAAYGYIQGISKEIFKEDALKLKETVEEVLENCTKVLDLFNKIQEKN
ncbi:MAG: HEPN domain protein [Promethearchaeota archaeon]|jgi:HEPN domain-containing protein|nr:MAG: HEPN domain protein [Candidatus Lokiarchaeota archaeon]